MDYFRVRNFERFQHYADRKPPWIKLYKDLWRDPRFFALSENDRYQLISLFILASQNDNKIPVNQDWLQHELCTKKAISLETLVASQWVEYLEQDASMVLAGCQQDAIPRALARVEKRREEKNTCTKEGYSEEFERFWGVYPRKAGKGEAWKSWQKNGHPPVDDIVRIIELAKQTPQWTKNNGQFIPMPSTWLNQKRWGDEYKPKGTMPDKPEYVG